MFYNIFKHTIGIQLFDFGFKLVNSHGKSFGYVVVLFVRNFTLSHFYAVIYRQSHISAFGNFYQRQTFVCADMTQTGA